MRAEKSKIIIEPTKDTFTSLGGSFKVKKPIPAERIRKIIGYSGNKKYKVTTLGEFIKSHSDIQKAK